jgi:uncharacterized protein YneF (UPF0154 family)
MKPKTKTILFILLSFILGIFCGWFLEDRLFNSESHPSMKGPTEFLKVLTNRVHLNEHQVAQVDSILESKRQKMNAFKKQTLALRDTTRQEMRRLLNADQIKLFDEFVQEKDQQEARKRDREQAKK